MSVASTCWRDWLWIVQIIGSLQFSPATCNCVCRIVCLVTRQFPIAQLKRDSVRANQVCVIFNFLVLLNVLVFFYLPPLCHFIHLFLLAFAWVNFVSRLLTKNGSFHCIAVMHMYYDGWWTIVPAVMFSWVGMEYSDLDSELFCLLICLLVWSVGYLLAWPSLGTGLCINRAPRSLIISVKFISNISILKNFICSSPSTLYVNLCN